MHILRRKINSFNASVCYHFDFSPIQKDQKNRIHIQSHREDNIKDFLNKADQSKHIF